MDQTFVSVVGGFNMLGRITRYTMSGSKKTIRVPEWYHEWVTAEKEEGETYWETLVRMTGGPSPEVVAGILSDESAEEMRDILDEKKRTNLDGKRERIEKLRDDS